MGKWRDAALAAQQSAPAAPVPADLQAPPVDTFGLPASLAADLRRLETLRPPAKLKDARNWRPIIDDALRLARDGWAATALSLGWSAHDLFGIGPRDDWEFTGLAVWLRGRELAMLDGSRAIARTDLWRGDFIRGGMGHGTHPRIAPVLLWEFGR